MREADYYPPGAYNDPNAPWNEPSIPEIEFEVTISQTLSKGTNVTTNDYTPQCDMGEEDGIGYCNKWNDTSNTDWKKAYEDEHFTPLELIGKLREYVEMHLVVIEMELAAENPKTAKTTLKAVELRRLLKECDDWCEDETEIVED